MSPKERVRERPWSYFFKCKEDPTHWSTESSSHTSCSTTGNQITTIPVIFEVSEPFPCQMVFAGSSLPEQRGYASASMDHGPFLTHNKSSRHSKNGAKNLQVWVIRSQWVKFEKKAIFSSRMLIIRRKFKPWYRTLTIEFEWSTIHWWRTRKQHIEKLVIYLVLTYIQIHILACVEREREQYTKAVTHLYKEGTWSQYRMSIYAIEICFHLRDARARSWRGNVSTEDSRSNCQNHVTTRKCYKCQTIPALELESFRSYSKVVQNIEHGFSLTGCLFQKAICFKRPVGSCSTQKNILHIKFK